MVTVTVHCPVAIQMKFIVMVVVLPGTSAFVVGHVNAFSSCPVSVKPVNPESKTKLIIYLTLPVTIAFI